MTATQEQVLPPPIMWAQRANIVILTINLEDVKEEIIKFEKDSLYFKGVGGLLKKQYEVTVPLYAEVDPDKCKSFNRGRCIEVLLAKAVENQPYWPALTKDKKKYHFIKCDFNKWQDEGDSADEEAGPGGDLDVNAIMRSMSGLGGGGGERPSLDDLNMDNGGNSSGDSDDEDLPDLE